MKIAADTVALIEYTLHSDDGQLLDSSGDQPMAYLHGHGQIIPGLEQALEGKVAGEEITTQVEPGDAYGDRDDQKVVKVDRSEIPDDVPVEVGAVLGATGPDGKTVPLWVISVEDEHVILDGNHPLAGQRLSFEAKITEVRAASPEELSHGHAHGPGGAH